jgi:hypothetical protein
MQDPIPILELDANHGYGLEPIPVERDSQIARLLDDYASAPQAESHDFRERLGVRHAPVLRAFAERMASLAVRECSLRPLRVALLALALGGAADDVREAILILPLVYRSAELIGADAAALFAEAAAMCDEAFAAQEIEAFPRRNRQDRSLAEFGYVESADPDGFRYQRTW